MYKKPFPETLQRMKKKIAKVKKAEEMYPRLSLEDAKKMISTWSEHTKIEQKYFANMKIIKELQEACDLKIQTERLTKKEANLLRVLFKNKMLELEHWSLEYKLTFFHIEIVGQKKRKNKIVKKGKEQLKVSLEGIASIIRPLYEQFKKDIGHKDATDIVIDDTKKLEEELINYRRIKNRLKVLKGRSVFHKDGFFGSGNNDTEIERLENELEKLLDSELQKKYGIRKAFETPELKF